MDVSRSLRGLTRVSLAGVLLAGCAAAPQPPTPSPPPLLPSSPGGVPGRDCSTLVSVGLAEEAWRTAPVAGPAVFAPLDYVWGDRAGFAQRPPDSQGWRRFKVAMRLRGGAPATVTVAGAQRGVAALTYRNGLDGSVSFAACNDASQPEPSSEFAGGFALREAACLAVDVTAAGRTDRLVLDFGKGGC